MLCLLFPHCYSPKPELSPSEESTPRPPLPNELVLEIFRHMDELQLARAEQTCHQFRNLAAICWEELGKARFPNSPDAEYAGKLVRLSGHLRSIKERGQHTPPRSISEKLSVFYKSVFAPHYSSAIWRLKQQAEALNLPELQLGPQVSSSGELDYIHPQDVPWPIMHGTDCLQRPFITIKVRSKDETTLIAIHESSIGEYGTAIHVFFEVHSVEDGVRLYKGTHYNENPITLLNNIFKNEILDFTKMPKKAPRTIRIQDITGNPFLSDIDSR